MSARWHLVTGEYPPAIGGVGLFTRALARALASRHAEVHVWTPLGGGGDPGVRVHALPDRFGRESRRLLAAICGGSDADVVLLQYTPNLLGARGANVPFCLWLAGRMRRGADIRVVFHEPFFYFGAQSLARNALAATHRLMALLLLSSARTVYLSTETWRRFLQPYAVGRTVRWIVLPVTLGTPPAVPASAMARVRATLGPAIVGCLGGYAAETRHDLAEAVRAVLASAPQATVLCVGRGSEAFARALDEPRVRGTGELPAAAMAAHVAACDVAIAPFDEGITARRTSVLAALAAGVPVAASDGRHTEPWWRESGAVALAPAGAARALAATCARLLASPEDRRRLGAAGRALYDARFSPEAALSALGFHAFEPAPAHLPGR